MPSTSDEFISSQDIDKYMILGQIGVGSSATVYKAEDLDRPFESPLRSICIKRLRKKYEAIGKQESAVLHKLKGSEYFVKHFGSFAFAGDFLITMELLNYARPFGYSPNSNYVPRPEGFKTLAKISLQLLSAITELNDLGLAYCDLKPENIMYAEDDHFKLKIVDLGSATPLEKLSTYHSDFEVQSIAYRAPEVFLGDPTFNHKIDVWSLGVILLEFYINNYMKSTKKLDYWRLVSVQNKDTIVEGMIDKFGSALVYKDRAKFWTPKYEALSTTRQAIPLIDSLRGHGRDSQVNLFLNFLNKLLTLDHDARPSAKSALSDPFLSQTLLGSWSKYLAKG